MKTGRACPNSLAYSRTKLLTFGRGNFEKYPGLPDVYPGKGCFIHPMLELPSRCFDAISRLLLWHRGSQILRPMIDFDRSYQLSSARFTARNANYELCTYSMSMCWEGFGLSCFHWTWAWYWCKNFVQGSWSGILLLFMIQNLLLLLKYLYYFICNVFHLWVMVAKSEIFLI